MLRVLVIAGVLAGCTETTPRQSDVVLVTWDTVRADRVGHAYTPGWNALAEHAAVFTEARTPVPITLPAHASIMTGRTPPVHEARDNGTWPMSDALPTLAERFQAAGWTTGAFVSAAVLDSRYGIGRGFSTYDDHIRPGKERTVASRSATDTVEAALAWLGDRDPTQPVFLWVHLFDPHRPWNAPAPYDRFDPYEAEIARADAQTQRLLTGLDHRGGLEHAVVVITSDHGEGLGEHGETTHGYFAYDSTIRVPLLIRTGSQTSRGRTSPATVPGPSSLLDLAPTLLELAGLDPMDVDGRSLVGHLGGAPIPPRMLGVETITPALDFDTAPIFGVYDDAQQAWYDTPRIERYALGSDPQQLINRFSPDDQATADRIFSAFDRRWPPETTPMQLDPDQRAQLEALGYVTRQTLTDSVDATDPVDPKDRVDVFELLTQTPDEPAERLLDTAEAMIERHGPVPALMLFSADLLDALGRPRDALAVVETAAAAHPTDRDIHQERRQRVQKLNQLTQLATAIQEQLDLDPADLTARRDLALTLHRLQSFAEAEQAYRVVLDAEPGNDALRIGLARALASQGRFEHALAALAPALQRPGHDTQIDCTAGRIMARGMNREEEAQRLLTACKN